MFEKGSFPGMNWLERLLNEETMSALITIAALKIARRNPKAVAQNLANLFDGLMTPCGGVLVAEAEEDGDVWLVRVKDLVRPGTDWHQVWCGGYDEEGEVFFVWM